jgi:hypothetical protein
MYRTVANLMQMQRVFLIKSINRKCEQFHGKKLPERLKSGETKILKGWVMKTCSRCIWLTIQSKFGIWY